VRSYVEENGGCTGEGHCQPAVIKNVVKEKVLVQFGSSSVYPTSLYSQTSFPKISASGFILYK
jgi:hypothetical protein